MEKVKATFVKFKRWLIASVTIIIVLLTSFFAIPVLFPPTPATGEAPTTLQVSVAASLDDAYATMINDTTLYTTVTSAQMRSYTDQYSTSYCVAGFRFVLPIPKVAVIVSANLSFYMYSASYDDANMKIYAEAVDNASNFSDNAHIGNTTYRPRTTNYVSWTANATGTGNITKTGFKPVIQEVVSRAGWISGNALTLLAIPNTDQTLLFFVRTFDNSAATAACLFIEYSTTNEEVYTNAFDASLLDWTEVGATPYLDDSNANYIYTSTNLYKEGNWTFPTSFCAGLIISVKFKFQANVTVANCGVVNAYVWNGTSWTALTEFAPTASDAWYELNASAVLDTWAKINGAKIYIVYSAEGAGTCNIRRLTRAIEYFVDSTPPTYSDVASNAVLVGHPCKFSVKVTDEKGLATTGGFIFETNNTGTPTNDSWTPFTTNPDWSNVTKNLNPTVGVRVEWRIYFNDTSNNWNATIIQYLITTGIQDNLISNLMDLVDRINWTESIATIYLGTMFDKTNMTDLQNAIAASTSWKDVLLWSAITIKFGIENETKIKWALDNASMTYGLPVTEINAWGSTYLVHNRGALYGYHWADKYSYLQSKWNTTEAFNNFANAYNWTGHGFLWYLRPNWTESYTGRFFDECAETLACFLIFYEVCNVSEALVYAETEWKYLNNNYWCVEPYWGDPHFTYTMENTTMGRGWECSGGAFLQIIGWLKYLSPSVGNISRLVVDMSNRFISLDFPRWESPQWITSGVNRTGTVNVYQAVVIHHSWSNTQRRLTSTVTAFSSLFSMYLLFDATEIGDFQAMLNGYTYNGTTYLPAWKSLYNTTTELYNASTATFKYYSGNNAADNTSMALTTALQFIMGMTPVNTTLAVPIESLEYEHLYNMFDSQIFNMSLTTRKVTVGINKVGAINFTYNATATQMFNSAGLYELTFDSNWNTITNCTKIGSLPSRRYLQLASNDLVVGWNAVTPFSIDVDKTLGQVNASLNLDSINWSVITISYGNGTQWSLVYGTSYNSEKLIASMSNTLYIYCNVAGTWGHEYP